MKTRTHLFAGTIVDVFYYARCVRIDILPPPANGAVRRTTLWLRPKRRTPTIVPAPTKRELARLARQYSKTPRSGRRKRD